MSKKMVFVVLVSALVILLIAVAFAYGSYSNLRTDFKAAESPSSTMVVATGTVTILP